MLDEPPFKKQSCPKRQTELKVRIIIVSIRLSIIFLFQVYVFYKITAKVFRALSSSVRIQNPSWYPVSLFTPFL